MLLLVAKNPLRSLSRVLQAEESCSPHHTLRLTLCSFDVGRLKDEEHICETDLGEVDIFALLELVDKELC